MGVAQGSGRGHLSPATSAPRALLAAPAPVGDVPDLADAPAIGIGHTFIAAAAIAKAEKAAAGPLQQRAGLGIGAAIGSAVEARHLPVEGGKVGAIADSDLAAGARTAAVKLGLADAVGTGGAGSGSSTGPGASGVSGTVGGTITSGPLGAAGSGDGAALPMRASVASGTVMASAPLSVTTSPLRSATGWRL